MQTNKRRMKMKIAYISKRFSLASLVTIERANEIIDEYQVQDFSLTLRQLYYQFVARGLIANKQTEYKRLGSIINDGRLAGLIDWYSIEDRTRFLRGLAHWESPADVLKGAARQYRVDKWERQSYRPEVWIEKDALVGVISGVCNRNDVPFFACRGYVSQSETWRAARRFYHQLSDGQKPLVIHLGDHDPSGIDMTRDINDRLGVLEVPEVKVIRIALNMDQVEEFNPPPNPAKLTDSRASDYIEKYGSESWELDALEPSYIAEIIQKELDKILDPAIWEEDVATEDEAKRRLQEIAENWED
jgi:hypothetical protein